MKYILLDVEGTTTSIEFVHRVLFPYSTEKMDWFINHYPDLCQTERAQVESEYSRQLSNLEFVDLLLGWIKDDKKHPALKSIQGKIWQLGYERQEIKGHVYLDVLPAFQKWQKQGIKIGIYSSGSVLAQKLLFAHSQVGDLTVYIDHHFDTLVGAKREVSSYKTIAQKISINSEEILFLSDIAEECLAAISAGMKSAQLIRDQLANPHPELRQLNDFLTIPDFV